MQYDYNKHTMNCIGSIADVYRNEVAEAAQILGVTLGQIKKSPMEGFGNLSLVIPTIAPLSKGGEKKYSVQLHNVATKQINTAKQSYHK